MEFISTKEQLRATLTAQFLSQPESCKCVFENATFSKTGVTSEITFVNGEIGRRAFTTPGDCSTSSVPMKLVSSTERINNMIATSIKIKDIQDVSGVFLGKFQVKIETNKKITGSSSAQIEIPVVIATAPDTDATRWKINGCSLTGVGASVNLPKCRVVFEIFEHNGCNGRSSYRHSDWTNEGAAGSIKWAYRESSVLYGDENAVGADMSGSYLGRNRITADVSCSRIGIQCQ